MRRSVQRDISGPTVWKFATATRNRILFATSPMAVFADLVTPDRIVKIHLQVDTLHQKVIKDFIYLFKTINYQTGFP